MILTQKTTNFDIQTNRDPMLIKNSPEDVRIKNLLSTFDQNEGFWVNIKSEPDFRRYTDHYKGHDEKAYAIYSDGSQMCLDISWFLNSAYDPSESPSYTAFAQRLEEYIEKETPYYEERHDYHIKYVNKKLKLGCPETFSVRQALRLWQEQITILHNLKHLLNLIRSSETYLRENPTISETKMVRKHNPNNKVFIVHGHDHHAKESTAHIVEQLKLEAIILHEQTNNGDTIIQKLERHSDVSFAIVLYTPDDHTGDNHRARQNVVFEHGYMIGKLGRQHVVALVKDGVEKPSDIDGIVYIAMDGPGAWKHAVGRELKSVGFDVDLNLIR